MLKLIDRHSFSKKRHAPDANGANQCVAWAALLAGVACLSMLGSVHAQDTYYVGPSGSDSNDGAQTSPYGTFDHAIDQAGPGDTIYALDGTYELASPVTLDKAGTANNPINLHAAPGANPVLDFSSNPRHSNPPKPRQDDSIAGTSDAFGIHVAGSAEHWHVKGLTVQDAPYYGVRVYGSHNTFEQMTMRRNKASGLEITGKGGFTPSHNLVLNSDSYRNFDVQTNGEDADGFTAKFDTTDGPGEVGPGNVFRGLRAWSNSDDGYDFWHAAHTVKIENSWAFDNGFKRQEWDEQITGDWRGDGLGFKLGQDAAQLVLENVVAFGNKAYGIDENGNSNPEGLIIKNATLVNNAKNGNPIQISLNDGAPHTVINTIAFDIDGNGVTEFTIEVDDTNNTWNGIGVDASDFQNLDMAALFAQATAARKADGSLPDIGLALSQNSHLIDAGVDVGLPYNGDAPDLGAIETPEPTSAALLIGGASLLLTARPRKRHGK